MNPIRSFAAKIREINARYQHPRIEMSRAVRVSLMTLRLYLFTLVGLMVYKFVILVIQG
jgi:hypothetical protein